MTKDAELQMQLRGILSDKQKLINNLEVFYKSATSEKSFYKLLKQKGYKLYSRGSKTVGVLLNRKYRFSTLGFDYDTLRLLDQNQSLQKRLNTLKSIQQREDEKDLGRERKRQ